MSRMNRRSSLALACRSFVSRRRFLPSLLRPVHGSQVGHALSQRLNSTTIKLYVKSKKVKIKGDT
jgi:hypothetical protein